MPRVKVFPDGEVNLATQLRYFRKKLALHQSEMAVKLGISLSLYTKLEVGLSETTPRRVEQFAEVLHTTSEFLLYGTGDENRSNSPEGAPRLSDALLEQILTLATDAEIRAAADKIAETTQRTPIQTLAVLVKAMILGDK